MRLVPPSQAELAPQWEISEWLNHDPMTLMDLRGRVVVLHAFQMLCPGCVTHGVPQAQKIHEAFPDVAVVGLHTVFEHHDAMQPLSLRAFLHEFRVRFPVAVDEPGRDGPIPVTMRSFGMRGTPTLILIDREGRIRHHAFGRVDDMLVGSAVATLSSEARRAASEACDDQTCRIQTGSP